MLERIKSAKYYGIDKTTYNNAAEVIAKGNDQSLTAMCLINAAFLTIMTVINFSFRHVLQYTYIPAFCAIIVAILYLIARKNLKKGLQLFYYLTFECQIFYGVYAMSQMTLTGAVMYTAVVTLLPLFYMDNYVSQVIFSFTNAAAIIILGAVGPEAFSYIRTYTVTIVSFNVVGVVIHYVYQSNRTRELVNFKTTIDSENALAIRSTFENLSHLLQRRSFIELTEKAVSDAKPEDFIAVGILDIDHFKFINDTYGHQLGDATITAIGDVMASAFDVGLVAPSDVTNYKLDLEGYQGNLAGRLGGDEFIFFIRDEEDRAGLDRRLERFTSQLRETQVGPLTNIQCSVGISVIEDRNPDYDSWYRQADSALYTAKANGRNQVVYYDPNMVSSEEIKHKSEKYDQLTGLLTAKAFKGAFAEAVSDLDYEKYGVIHLDIENFKAFNAQYGFKRGDEFLQELARLLQETYPGTLLSRFSDDHFVGLVPLESIEHNIGSIKFKLRKYRGDYKHSIRVGIYQLESDQVDVNLACDHAKYACDTIRGRFDMSIRYFNKQLDELRDRYQYVVENIDKAIEHEWLKVYYQPIIRTYTGQVCALEALCRWEDPELGVLPPSDFIETLESTRLIYKLDMYMVEHICKDFDLAKRHNMMPIPVSVNLSRLDFEVIDVISEVENLIAEYDLDRELLHIEITESALTEERDTLSNIMAQFQDIGYQLWMDDFGAGYSSLNVLKDYNFNVIKFDMEFLANNSVRARSILTSIVDMAKKLGLQTLAEGVETEEQYHFLKTIGCEFVQGYFFSKPKPSSKFATMLGGEHISGVEPMELREYYNAVGRKNVLTRIHDEDDNENALVGNSRSVGVLEWKDGHGKFLMHTEKFMYHLNKSGVPDMDAFEQGLNDDTLYASHLYRAMLDECAASEIDAKGIANLREQKLVVYLRFLARNPVDGKAAILVSLSDISEREIV